MTTEQHGPTVPVYVGIFAALMILTAITVGVAFVNLGPLNNVVMLGIAVTKATLVVLYFMHVRYGPRLIWAVAAGGFAWLGILVAFTVSDYMTRIPYR